MTALYTLQGSHLLVCMCGLPARGKTYIAQKGNSWESVTVADRRIVSRYLTWLSIPTKTFNVGQYRRNGGNAHPPASFFDPNNQEGSRQRELAAQEAFNDLLKWYTEGGVVAILDATNSTRKRREWIQMKCDDAGIQLMFVESVCDSEELVLSNILDVKVSSPDYIGQDPEKVRLNCCWNVC
jgi:6-phosphofructo-2-kinase/fructose-2,6-biphosphatase 2